MLYLTGGILTQLKNSSFYGKASQLVAFATITFLRINAMCKTDRVTIATKGNFKSPLMRNAVFVSQKKLDAVVSCHYLKNVILLFYSKKQHRVKELGKSV